jgi:integrase
MLTGGLTPNTINASMRVLSAALTAAAEEALIPANPCLNLRALQKTPTNRTAVPLDVLEAVRNAMPTHRDRLMVSILAYAGLRPGELVALQQADVDSGFITVRHAIGPGGLKGTKTGKVRTVPIRPEVERDLAEYDLQASGRLLEGERGAAVDWNNWGERVWRATCKKLDVSYPPYSLRHTYASLLIAEGHSVVEVAAWMGHANASTTLTNYAHLFARAPSGQRLG